MHNVNLDLTNNRKIRNREVDALGRSHAAGKYKTSVARVYLRAGDGQFLINQKTLNDYFSRKLYLKTIEKPFAVTGTINSISVWADVSGGGITAQCRAITLAISKALVKLNPEYYLPLREHKLTTSINRPVERKKPGQPKARKKKPTSRR